MAVALPEADRRRLAALRGLAGDAGATPPERAAARAAAARIAARLGLDPADLDRLDLDADPKPEAPPEAPPQPRQPHQPQHEAQQPRQHRPAWAAPGGWLSGESLRRARPAGGARNGTAASGPPDPAEGWRVLADLLRQDAAGLSPVERMRLDRIADGGWPLVVTPADKAWLADLHRRQDAAA